MANIIFFFYYYYFVTKFFENIEASDFELWHCSTASYDLAI